MAFRTWIRALGAAFGAAALAGAVQLGVGYGLDLVRLRRAFAGPTAEFWPTQLTWLAWFALVATVVGGYAAHRVAAGRYPARHGLTGRSGSAGYDVPRSVAFALFAAAGSAIAVVGLSALPARDAVGPDEPLLVTAATGGVGATVGVLAAVAVLSHRVLRWNVLAFTATLWLLAVASAAPVLRAGDPVAEIRLGVFDPAGLDPAGSGRQAFLLLPALALLVGASVSALARWLAQPVLAGAVAGMAGPAILNAAYLIAGAGQGGRYQDDPYWAALLAVAAGGLGSIAATAIGRRPTALAKPEPAKPEPAKPVPAKPVPPAKGADLPTPQPAPAPKSTPQPAPPPKPAPAPKPDRKPAPVQEHPGSRTPPKPLSVAPRAIPAPVSSAKPPVPASTSAERVTPQPVAPPPVAPTPVSAAPVVPASTASAPTAPTPVAPVPAGRVPRPRFLRPRRQQAPPAALTDAEKEHVDWVDELRRPAGRQSGDQASGK
ncbi:hypothetical protein [Micromonospora sp. NBC_01813]|uniref:hypothetical protein n=1 Tax=Micromonospora sp. NBC_01813 TaxID=2975988 RepID=UPI002DD895DD|nr:hypothetical protein [Micromonospora sp. NBC_01813]WSA08228.1 hypothetical protein OG958_29165 [Micromonospora sp. NBC_01813]